MKAKTQPTKLFWIISWIVFLGLAIRPTYACIHHLTSACTALLGQADLNVLHAILFTAQ